MADLAPRQFPRSRRRFTLGERLEARLLSVLERLVKAAQSREKRVSLTRANLDLEMLRHLWRRLAFEPQVIPIRRYEHGAPLMDDMLRTFTNHLLESPLFPGPGGRGRKTDGLSSNASCLFFFSLGGAPLSFSPCVPGRASSFFPLSLRERVG